MGQQALVALIAASLLIAAYPLIDAELDRANFGYQDVEPFAHRFPNATGDWPESSSTNMVTSGTLTLDNNAQPGNWTSETITHPETREIRWHTLNYTAVNNPSGTVTIIGSDDNFATVAESETYVLNNGFNEITVAEDVTTHAYWRVRVSLDGGTGGLEDLGINGDTLFIAESLSPVFSISVRYIVVVAFFFLIALWLMRGGRR